MSSVAAPSQPSQHDSGLPSLARNTVRKPTKTFTPPPAMKPEDVPWRGHGGRPPTFSSIEFDRQLDKIAVWLEDWNHDQVSFGSCYCDLFLPSFVWRSLKNVFEMSKHFLICVTSKRMPLFRNINLAFGN